MHVMAAKGSFRGGETPSFHPVVDEGGGRAGAARETIFQGYYIGLLFVSI